MHLAARIAAHDMDCDAHKGVMSIMHNYWADACWPFIAGRVSCMLYRIGQVELHAILRLRNFLRLGSGQKAHLSVSSQQDLQPAKWHWGASLDASFYRSGLHVAGVFVCGGLRKTQL